MTSLAERLARPEILALPPVNVIAGDGGDYQPEVIRLHLNECGYAPLAPGFESATANRYAQPEAPVLRRVMAALYGVAPESLLVTRGADDAIDILIRTFCRSGVDSIAVCKPSFGAYGLFAQIQGAEIVQVPLGDDFAFDAEDFVTRVNSAESVKLAFICSPNNPTGNVVAPADVLQVADTLPDTIVVLDEAYVEFAEVESLAAEATRRENLVVLRTLSKAYGIAGARIGCAIGPVDLIRIIARALPPFPLSSASIALALATLSPSRRPILEARIASTKIQRERMSELLRGSPKVKKVWPSSTNFLLIELEDLEAMRRAFDARGIRVRYRPDIGPGTIRLSIGTEADNDLALAAFGIDCNLRPARAGTAVRDTKETAVTVAIDLDRTHPRSVRSGIPFFDHMMDQVAAHGGFSIQLACQGDTQIDAHHSVEDCAIVFGKAMSDALGDRRGVDRFGAALPMDEAQATVLIDLSGRPFCKFAGKFSGSHIGDYPTEMTAHVFRSIADSLGATIHVRVEGENDHHKTEACFKALGRALRQAIAVGPVNEVPSTKGLLA